MNNPAQVGNPANPEDVTPDTNEQASVNAQPAPAIGANMAALLAAVEAAKEHAAAEAEKPVTIADVAAAAFVALETLVALMPTAEKKEQIIEQFEQRAALFALSMEEGE